MFSFRAVALISATVAICLAMFCAAVASPTALSWSPCDKCNVPFDQGGCKCDKDCNCLSFTCAKCNLPQKDGGCECDNDCNCLVPPACVKCNIPLNEGGCKCDKDCKCVSPECEKCNIPPSQGGCKCDKNCTCKNEYFLTDKPGRAGVSKPLVVGVSVGGGVALLGILAASCIFFRICQKHKEGAGPESFQGLQVYSYTELRAATSDFRDHVGGGASADVFRAQIDGRTVAVKRLKEEADHGTSNQEFAAEARTLGQMVHVNLVRLLGYSNDANRPKMLVYEFIDGGTLQSLLYGGSNGHPRVPLSLDRRLVIAMGIARGIEYCHHSIEAALIHRDIKPANVLMTSADERGIPKVADFGLARILNPGEKATTTHFIVKDLNAEPCPLVPQVMDSSDISTSTATNNAGDSSSAMKSASTGTICGQNWVSTFNPSGIPFTAIAGTPGYIDPEYWHTSRPTLKSDVYSFGVVLLELIMGAKPLHIYRNLIEVHEAELATNDEKGDNSEHSCPLVDASPSTFVYQLGKLLKQGEAAVVAKVKLMLDQEDVQPHLCFEAMKIAHQCLQEEGQARPPMRKVVRMLEHLAEGMQQRPHIAQVVIK